MSKRKIGASLLTMMALVLMFSITTLAATGVTNLKASVDSGKITATWTDDTESTSGYTVTVKEGTTAVATDVPVAQGVKTFEHPVTAGKTYTVEVTTVNGTNTGELSSVTVAPGPVSGFKVTVENGVLKALWTDVSDSTSKYVVTVLNGTTNVGGTDTAGILETEYSLPVTKDKMYKVEVAIKGGYSDGQKTSLEIFAPPSNKVMTVADKDNNLGNANFSGLNVTVNNGSKAIGQDGAIKDNQADGPMTKNDGSKGTHRTHGEYQNNTNSCASCHQTHTGASKNLLFKDGVYNTCTACHDGTLGMYNVFNHSNAGTFGGTEAGNMSVHLADGSVQIKAAPGGNLSANSGAWINEFNCASCHSPHGSYSERLLHYNPNGMGLQPTTAGGIGIKGQNIVNYADIEVAVEKTLTDGTKVKKLPYIWTFYNDTTGKLLDSTKTPPKFIPVRGTGEEILGESGNTDVIIAVYEFKAGSYGTLDSYISKSTPWLYGYGYANPNKNYYTRFFDTNYKAKQVVEPAKIQKKDADGKPLYWEGAEGTSNEVLVGKNSDGSYRLPVMVLAWEHKTDPKKSPVQDGSPDADTNKPWYSQYELTFDQVKGTWHYKYVVDNHDQDWTNQLVIKWDQGYIRAKDTTTKTLLNNAVTADVGRAYEVDLDLQEIARFGDATGVPVFQSNVNALWDGTLKDQGVAMSTYCAACHTDYLAKSGSSTGTFNQAYRHTTTSDTYTCVRCHYAHGTDVTVMMDAEGHKVGDILIPDNPATTDVDEQVIATTDYMLDQNPSSALKRYTNMSVCWGCHTDSKAEQLKNTDSYGDAADPHGLGEQPAMPGTITDANNDKVIINGN